MCVLRPAKAGRVWPTATEAAKKHTISRKDAKAGKLDGRITEALADYKAGKAREL
jgi:hypothetical protein